MRSELRPSGSIESGIRRRAKQGLERKLLKGYTLLPVSDLLQHSSVSSSRRANKPFKKRLIAGALAGLASLVVPAAAFGQAQPSLHLRLVSSSPQIVVTGAVGTMQVLDGAESLTATPVIWRTLAWQLVTNSPWSYTDTAPSSTGRFYRMRVYTNLPPANPNPSALAWIPPGTFLMGSPPNDVGQDPDETQHTVTLSRGFYIGKFLVTQSDFLTVLGRNPSYFSSSNYLYWDDLSRPVEQVSWNDAQTYCMQLNQIEQQAGRLPAGWAYRLPTESEWEYACRAGTITAFYFGNAIYDGMANFNSHYEYDASIGDIPDPNPPGYVGMTLAVGSYQANPWGLFDTHGNIWEWCQDWYGAYPAGPVTDPQGAVSGSARVFRGGAWSYVGRYCRSAARNSDAPATLRNSIGFRVVLAPAP
jgi:formylglycine-generating enzyme required for sulfatase activity